MNSRRFLNNLHMICFLYCYEKALDLHCLKEPKRVVEEPRYVSSEAISMKISANFVMLGAKQTQ